MGGGRARSGWEAGRRSILSATALAAGHLATLNGDIGGAVLVAGWITPTPVFTPTSREADIARSRPETSIDFEEVKSNAGQLVALFSRDDPFVAMERGKRHVSGEDGVRELAAVLKEVIKMSGLYS